MGNAVVGEVMAVVEARGNEGNDARFGMCRGQEMVLKECRFCRALWGPCPSPLPKCNYKISPPNPTSLMGGGILFQWDIKRTEDKGQAKEQRSCVFFMLFVTTTFPYVFRLEEVMGPGMTKPLLLA